MCSIGKDDVRRNRMKIAFILPGRGRSGGVRCTVIAGNYLRRRGHSVRIFYQRAPASLRNGAQWLWYKMRYASRCDWLDLFEGDILGYRDLADCSFAPDEIIVTVGMWCSARVGRINSRDALKVQYLHGLSPWAPDDMKIALEMKVPKIAVSSWVAEAVIREGKGRLLGVVPNGVDTSEYFASCSEDERNGVGTIFSNHPAKDPETTLAVLARLRKDLPGVPQYVFGACSRPSGIPKETYVRFPTLTGAVDRYSRSLVWILASQWEGFPGPVLESMACGCAVVATDCRGVRDIITDGENGFVVDVGDVEQLVERIKLLLNDNGLRQQMVNKAKQTIHQFSWENSVDQLEDVLKLLISKAI